MRVLIAEDDRLSRRLLQANLERAGHEVIETGDGVEAWQVLESESAPRLAVLDWMMPHMDGLEVCRRVRGTDRPGYVYIILLTARSRPEDLVSAFEAGADDYVIKPFDARELRWRVEVGARMLELQTDLERKITELSAAANHVERLQELLPVCMHCKKIRDDDATWHRIESYVEQVTGAEITHGLCEECRGVHYPRVQQRIEDRRRSGG
jgi:DNA-binding response OmpR family regulator